MLYHPSYMSVQPTSQTASKRCTMHIWRMHVAVVIRQFMMAAMHRRPGNHRASGRHAAGDSKQYTHGVARLEGSMRKQPMKSDRECKSRDTPHQEEESDIGCAQGPNEQKRNSSQCAYERENIVQDEVTKLQSLQIRTADRGSITLAGAASGR
jgi:hypothetical protein